MKKKNIAMRLKQHFILLLTVTLIHGNPPLILRAEEEPVNRETAIEMTEIPADLPLETEDPISAESSETAEAAEESEQRKRSEALTEETAETTEETETTETAEETEATGLTGTTGVTGATGVTENTETAEETETTEATEIAETTEAAEAKSVPVGTDPPDGATASPSDNEPALRSPSANTAPPPVTNLRAAGQGMRIKLLWNASPGADGYIIYRMAPGEDRFTYRYIVSGAGFTDQTVAEGFHFYRIYPYRTVNNKRFTGQSTDYAYARAIDLPAPVRKLRARLLPGGGVALSWEGDPRADGYVVRRMSGTQTQFSHLYLTQNEHFRDLKAPQDVWNYYRVLPYRMVGNKRYYGESDHYVYALPTSLPEVTRISIRSEADASIRLNWPSIPLADGYHIEHRIQGQTQFTLLASPTAAQFIDRSTVPDQRHEYRIRAYRLLGGIKASNPAYPQNTVSARPLSFGSVTGLRASSYDAGKILLRWKPLEGVDGYLIYRKVGTQTYRFRYPVSRPGFIDATAPLDTVCYYRVYPYKTVNGERVVGPSNRYVSAVANNLTAVTVSKGISLGAGGVQIEWREVPGAEAYAVFRREADAGGNYTHIGNSPGLRYVDSAPIPEKRNEYLVLAFKQLENRSVFGPVGGTVVILARMSGAPDGIPIVNKKNPMNPLKYYPDDLVYVGNQGQRLRSEAADAYNRMSEAAAAAGYPLIAQSGFRSYELQNQLYWMYVSQSGQAAADTFSARPGYSEHQTGLVMDILGGGAPMDSSFAYTGQYTWLCNNAHLYGWILRYPYGEEAITGYTYEPWHWRYIGVSEAVRFHHSGHKTLETFYGVEGGGYR